MAIHLPIDCPLLRLQADESLDLKALWQPCDKWPQCRYKDTECKFAHPTPQELQRAPTKLLSVEKDILPLVAPYKNSTVALTTLHSLLNKRLHFRSRMHELMKKAVAAGACEVQAAKVATQAVSAQFSNPKNLSSNQKLGVTQDEILEVKLLIAF